MSFSDLPTEILEQIYADLSDPTLCSLAQLSRHLNLTALAVYFERVKLHENGILKDGFLSYSLTSSWADRQTILRAIRSSLVINGSDIHSYKVELSPDIKDAITELRDVRGILKKMKKCTTLALSFAALDRPMSEQINVEEWREAVLGFLEEALKKGCQRLHILNGGHINSYCDSKGTALAASDLETWEALSDPTTSGSPPVAETVTWLSQMFPNNSQALQRRPWPPSTISQTQLTHIAFLHPLFLQPPFRNWTIHVLNHSPQLTTLSFAYQLQRMKSSELSLFLRGITCPALTDLRFMRFNPAFKDLSAFLQRHSSTLRKLEILPADDDPIYSGNQWSSRWFGGGADPSLTNEEQFTAPMPMLEEIYTTSAHFVWLMNQPLVIPPSSSSSSSIQFAASYLLGSPAFLASTQDRDKDPTLRNPAAIDADGSAAKNLQQLGSRFPRLREIGFYTDQWDSSQAPSFALIERAFDALGLYIQSTKASGSPSPVTTLVLSGLIRQQALSAFLTKCQTFAHQEDGGSGDQTISPSITSPPAGILTIRVEIRNYPDFMDSLLAFIKGFPEVGTLEIAGPSRDNLERLQRSYGGVILSGDTLKWALEIKR